MNKINKELNLYSGCVEIFPNFFWKIILKQSFGLQFYLIKKAAFVSVLKILKFSSVFRSNLLVDLSVTDFLNKIPTYFELIYIFRSIFLMREFSVFAPLISNTDLLIIGSVTILYENANWMEREMFDMFGVCFENHVDLRRILTDYGFKGHPLRKDFPLSGFKEVKYNWKFKTLVSNNLELSGMRYV